MDISRRNAVARHIAKTLWATQQQHNFQIPFTNCVVAFCGFWFLCKHAVKMLWLLGIFSRLNFKIVVVVVLCIKPRAMRMMLLHNTPHHEICSAQAIDNHHACICRLWWFDSAGEKCCLIPNSLDCFARFPYASCSWLHGIPFAFRPFRPGDRNEILILFWRLPFASKHILCCICRRVGYMYGWRVLLYSLRKNRRNDLMKNSQLSRV